MLVLIQGLMLVMLTHLLKFAMMELIMMVII